MRSTWENTTTTTRSGIIRPWKRQKPNGSSRIRFFFSTGTIFCFVMALSFGTVEGSSGSSCSGGGGRRRCGTKPSSSTSKFRTHRNIKSFVKRNVPQNFLSRGGRDGDSSSSSLLLASSSSSRSSSGKLSSSSSMSLADSLQQKQQEIKSHHHYYNRKACGCYIWDFPSALLHRWCNHLLKDCVYEGLGGKKFVRIQPGSILQLLYPVSRYSPDKCVLCGGTFKDHLELWWSKHLYTPFDNYLDRTLKNAKQTYHDDDGDDGGGHDPTKKQHNKKNQQPGAKKKKHYYSSNSGRGSTTRTTRGTTTKRRTSTSAAAAASAAASISTDYNNKNLYAASSTTSFHQRYIYAKVVLDRIKGPYNEREALQNLKRKILAAKEDEKIVGDVEYRALRTDRKTFIYALPAPAASSVATEQQTKGSKQQSKRNPNTIAQQKQEESQQSQQQSSNNNNIISRLVRAVVISNLESLIDLESYENSKLENEQ